MSESEARFLERLRDEAERGLGPGISVREVAATRLAHRTRITASCDGPLGPRLVEGEGSTLVEAAGRLLARVPEERLAVAFRRLVDEPPARRA
jgi:hypothetical protein